MNMETNKAAKTVPAAFRLAHAEQIREGYAARSTRAECPYPHGSDDAFAWEYGWDWADRRREAKR